jgi:hypothetical protein
VYSSDEILAAASAIVPHLPNLIGQQSDAVGAELNRLLDDALAGKPVDAAVIAVLTRHESTRSWTNFFLNGDERPAVETVRGFSPLPGQMPVPVPAQLYACPMPGCPTRWRCRTAGQPIPRCLEHHKPVEPLASPA